jgi:hypothetical protein
MKIDLFGARPENIKDLNRLSSVRIARPSVVCSKDGMGITIEENYGEYIRKILSKKLTDLKLNSLHKRYVIPIDHLAKRIFDTFMIVLIVYSVLSSLYFLAFHSMNQAAEIIDVFVWVMFILDFILNFFSEYIDDRRNRIRNLKMIIERYLKSYLFLDLIALIPLRYAGHPNGEFILRLLRTAKINKIFTLVDKYIIIEFLASLVYEAECLNKKKLRYKLNMMSSMFVQVLKMFFATYFLACLWYYYIDFILREKNESVDFIKNFNLQDDPTDKRFVKTWYYIFTTLVTVGYGDFYATNKYEMGFAIILVLAGTSWFAFMMGIAIRIMQEYDAETGNSAQTTSLNCWFSSIEKMHNSIPTTLKEKISLHFLNLWKNDRLDSIFNDSNESSFDPSRSSNSFFDLLPNRIQEDLLEYLFSDIFYTYKIFFNTVGDLKYVICRFLQPRLYQKGEIILKANEEVNEILFLSQGNVFVSILSSKCPLSEDVLDSIDISDYTIASLRLRKNCIIGEYYVLKNMKPRVFFHVKSNTKGFIMPAFVIEELKKMNREEFDKYIEKSKHIYDEIDKFYEETLRDHPQDTGYENLLKTEKSAEILETSPDLFEDDQHFLTNECLVHKEIDKVSKIVKDFNNDRRVLLTHLKEKIANLAVINLSWKHLISE